MKCVMPDRICTAHAGASCMWPGGPPASCKARAAEDTPEPEIVPPAATQEIVDVTEEVLDSLKWMAKDMDYRRSQTALCEEPLSPEMQQVHRLIDEMEAGTLIVTRIQKK